MVVEAGAEDIPLTGVIANDPPFPSVERGGSVLDQFAVGDSTTGDVGGTSRTGSEIGVEIAVGGTSRTGSESGSGEEPDPRALRRGGTASATFGSDKLAVTGEPVDSTIGGLTVSVTPAANGGGTGVDVAATGVGNVTGGATGLG